MVEAAETVVRDYYEALREGDPLAPYFLEDDSTVKFGIEESLFGYDEVADALRNQTETTTDWTVTSGRLVVEERDSAAWFADEVRMAWTDAESGEEREFESRWSGTLVPSPARTDASADGPADDPAPHWRFATMHVSTPRRLE
ncbi:SnoaL-like domain-containing protein [Halobiforma haloterrestris]|uniref:SnoaL-like domain-containing protein n=1 Tax=Natronobacterium haloterrestre TaxID=148448 RepID=A0A1I1JC75_NATHA|nr:nuclear transport factor 2 family protein [Halobiforma haloterrestris]SFC45592.1 SnoaL-like domain-containing protein [Halobiforma haloterrestris]